MAVILSILVARGGSWEFDDLMVAVDQMWSIFAQKNMPSFLISNSLRAKLKLLRIQRVDFLCFFNILSVEYNLIAVICLDKIYKKTNITRSNGLGKNHYPPTMSELVTANL